MRFLDRLRSLVGKITALRHRAGFVTRSELVAKIVWGTAGLALKKGDYRELPPVKGVWGLIRVTGNSLPRFTYSVFDTPKMEFVTITVDVALPNKILFTAKTEDLGEIPVAGWYCQPFYCLARQLFQYFPLLPDYSDAPVRPVGPLFVAKEEGNHEHQDLVSKD